MIRLVQVVTISFLLGLSLPIFAQESDEEYWDDVGTTTRDEVSVAESRAPGMYFFSLYSGVSDTEGKNYNPGYGWGVEISNKFSNSQSISLEVTGYQKDSQVALPKLTRTKVLGKGIFHFTESESFASYAALGVGPVWDTLSGSGTTMDLGVAPSLGFEVPIGALATRTSLGADAAYTFVGGGKADIFALNGKLKFGF